MTTTAPRFDDAGLSPPPSVEVTMGPYMSSLMLFTLDNTDASVVPPAPVPAPEERLAELGELQDGWLGDGEGKAPNPGLLRLALVLVQQFDRLDIPKPRIYPTPEGEIRFEWSTADREVALELEHDVTCTVYVTVRGGGQAHSTYTRPFNALIDVRDLVLFS